MEVMTELEKQDHLEELDHLEKEFKAYLTADNDLHDEYMDSALRRLDYFTRKVAPDKVHEMEPLWKGKQELRRCRRPQDGQLNHVGRWKKSVLQSGAMKLFKHVKARAIADLSASEKPSEEQDGTKPKTEEQADDPNIQRPPTIVVDVPGDSTGEEKPSSETAEDKAKREELDHLEQEFMMRVMEDDLHPGLKMLEKFTNTYAPDQKSEVKLLWKGEEELWEVYRQKDHLDPEYQQRRLVLQDHAIKLFKHVKAQAIANPSLGDKPLDGEGDKPVKGGQADDSDSHIAPTFLVDSDDDYEKHFAKISEDGSKAELASEEDYFYCPVYPSAFDLELGMPKDAGPDKTYILVSGLNGKVFSASDRLTPWDLVKEWSIPLSKIGKLKDFYSEAGKKYFPTRTTTEDNKGESDRYKTFNEVVLDFQHTANSYEKGVVFGSKTYNPYKPYRWYAKQDKDLVTVSKPNQFYFWKIHPVDNKGQYKFQVLREEIRYYSRNDSGPKSFDNKSIEGDDLYLSVDQNGSCSFKKDLGDDPSQLWSLMVLAKNEEVDSAEYHVSTYEKPEFKGEKDTLKLGEYSAAEIKRTGAGIKSMKVPQGLMVIAYDNRDYTLLQLTEDHPDLDQALKESTRKAEGDGQTGDNDKTDPMDMIHYVEVINLRDPELGDGILRYGDKVLLKSLTTNHFLEREPNGKLVVRHPTQNNDTQEFELVHPEKGKEREKLRFGDTVYLKEKDGHYVQTADDSSQLNATKKYDLEKLAKDTQFILVNGKDEDDKGVVRLGDLVVLQSVVHKSYLTVHGEDVFQFPELGIPSRAKFFIRSRERVNAFSTQSRFDLPKELEPFFKKA